MPTSQEARIDLLALFTTPVVVTGPRHATATRSALRQTVLAHGQAGSAAAVIIFPAWSSHPARPYRGAGTRLSIAMDVNV